MVWRCARGSGPDAVRLAERALAVCASGRVPNRKSGRRKELYFLRLAAPEGGEAEGEPDHLLKRNAYAGASRWRRRLAGSKARHELALAEALHERGLPTPVPLAAGEERRGLGVASDALLVPLLADVADLRALWQGGALAPREQRELASALGALARRTFDAGLFQDDLAPNNLLVRRGSPPSLWWIDFERAELRARVGARPRRRMLAKLDREMGDVSCALRMRFLRAYAGGAARELWRAQARYAAVLARRDHRRVLGLVARGSRRYARAAEDGWRGWTRTDVGVVPPPSAAEGDGVWWSALPETSAREGASLFALANVLHLRALAPLPLALWQRGREARVAWRAPARGRRLAAAEAAPEVRVLTRRLAALGELRAVREVALAPGPRGFERALCLDLRALRPSGRATPPPALANLLP